MSPRVIVLTDIHGAYARVDEILDRGDRFDAVVLGGDLTTMGSAEEARGALARFQRHGMPLLVIGGNMDPPDLDDLFVASGVSINATGVMIHDVGIFGVSAAPFSPLHTPNEVSEEEIHRRAEQGWSQVATARWKVFVPHAPPFNTKVDVLYSGEHVGSKSVRTFIEHRQPDLTLCGHIHEARGEDVIGKTKVVNCGAAGRGHYVIVEFRDSPVVTMI